LPCRTHSLPTVAFKNLLLIDDDEDDHDIFLTAAAEVSPAIRCVAMFDAAQALQKLEAKALRPEVIFLDLNMPGMNGQQFLAEIKKDVELRALPVIIFSTSSQPRTIEALKILGAHDFVTKPGLYDELVNVLKRILL
jgi:CheY-like chemotaxis protein